MTITQWWQQQFWPQDMDFLFLLKSWCYGNTSWQLAGKVQWSLLQTQTFIVSRAQPMSIVFFKGKNSFLYKINYIVLRWHSAPLLSSFFALSSVSLLKKGQVHFSLLWFLQRKPLFAELHRFVHRDFNYPIPFWRHFFLAHLQATGCDWQMTCDSAKVASELWQLEKKSNPHLS